AGRTKPSITQLPCALYSISTIAGSTRAAFMPFPPKRTGREESGRQMQVMSENSSEYSWRYPGWRVAAGSGVAVFVSFSSLLVFTFGVFLKPLAVEFGWSREAVSLAFAVAALGIAICSPLLGALLDRFGPRRIILPSLAVFGLAFASLSLLKGQLII